MLMLWTATASRDGDLRRLAADVLIEGIEDGRAHPASLAAVLQNLDSGGWLKSSRVIETLREVARVSALHQWTIAAIIEAALEVFLRQSSKANLGLELLLELMVDLGRGPQNKPRIVSRASHREKPASRPKRFGPERSRDRWYARVRSFARHGRLGYAVSRAGRLRRAMFLGKSRRRRSKELPERPWAGATETTVEEGGSVTDEGRGLPPPAKQSLELDLTKGEISA
jgi:hypothetical protein